MVIYSYSSRIARRVSDGHRLKAGAAQQEGIAEAAGRAGSRGLQRLTDAILPNASSNALTSIQGIKDHSDASPESPRWNSPLICCKI
jgi:hypothetical protein